MIQILLLTFRPLNERDVLGVLFFFVICANKNLKSQLMSFLKDKILYEGLTFDDVLLVPSYSEVLPREVDLSSMFTRNIRINTPVVSAAMDSVTEDEMAIASSSSVTVSIAADTTGVFIRIFLVNIELRLTSLGSISEYEGTRRTSSNVKPS
jgi:hypothetical protein